MSYFKNQWNLLIKSFKELDIRVVFIILYELLFYAMVFLSFFLFGRFLQSKAAEMNMLPAEKMMELSQEELNALLSSLKKYLFALILGIILLILAIFTAVCIFKALIWLTIAKKKPTVNRIKKFALINLVWLLIWAIPIIILFLIVKRELIAPLLVIITPLAMYFTNILCVFFTEKQELNIIKKAFRTGIKKLHLFIFPYLIIITSLVIVSQLYWIYKFLPEQLRGIITILILSAYMAWARIYIRGVVKDIEG